MTAKPTQLPVSGHGPQAVPSDAKSYHAIQLEDEKRALAERGLGRWAGEAKLPLRPGEVPKQSSGPWSRGDPFGPERPYSDTNPVDPSGVNRNKGV